MENTKQLFSFFDKKQDGKEVIYFDAACTYIKYRDTLSGMARYYQDFSCCSGDRESSYLGSMLQEEINSTRKIVKDFIGAGIDDLVIFTSGTTDGINKVISGVDEKKIFSFVVSDLEHNSNFLPQKEWSKRKNIPLHIIPYKKFTDRVLLQETLKNIPSPFLLSITHASNIIGGTMDVKMIGEVVHNLGGYILVDDAQFISYNKENTQENGIDFCVFSGHKIGGPTGIGILYVSQRGEEIIKYSQQLGGGTVKKIQDFDPQYKKLPYFLEGGVQDFGGILGLKSCIMTLNSIGLGEIHSHITQLTDIFYNTLVKKYEGEIDIISIPGSSLISCIPKNFSVVDFHQYTNFFLSDTIVSFRTGTMCADNYVNTYIGTSNIMRFSFGIYNTQQEIEHFFYILDNFLKNSK